jgi:hypothetical protein
MKKITTIQKKIIRTISNKKAREQALSLSQKLQILPYEKIILQACLKLMHGIHYKYAPASFTHTWTLSQDYNNKNNRNLHNENLYSIP